MIEGGVSSLHYTSRENSYVVTKGVSLMSNSENLFEKVVSNRINDQIEEALSEERNSFRPGSSTVDLIFTIRQLIEKTLGV